MALPILKSFEKLCLLWLMVSASKNFLFFFWFRLGRNQKKIVGTIKRKIVGMVMVVWSARLGECTPSVRQAFVSLLQGGPIEGFLKPLGTIVRWCSEGFQGAFNYSPWCRQALGLLYGWLLFLDERILLFINISVVDVIRNCPE